MELRNLITFTHVAELGSFTKAAENLNYVQSTVTAQIKQLEKELGYAVDVYGHYSSDGDTAVRTFDVRHALIGPGVYASHGYERSHIDGVKNTFALLCAYLVIEG